MMKKLQKAKEVLKESLKKIKVVYNRLPLWGKVIFVIVLLVAKFVIPDMISMPVLMKWVNKKYAQITSK